MYGRRTVLLLLILVAILAVVIRYPCTEHERYQADSYFIHYLSESIVDAGYAEWTISPLSYVGYFPLSYPSGVPFLLSEMSMLTGLSVDASILLFGIIIGVLFSLGVFCLGREFIPGVEFAILATLLATLGPRFVDTSSWVGSARAPLVLLLMMTVLIAWRSGESGRLRALSVAAMLTFGCIACHHMAVLFVLFGLAYLLASLGMVYSQRRMHLSRKRAATLYLLAVLSLCTIAPFFLFESLLDSVLHSFGSDYVFDFDPAAASVILNLGISYTHQIGFILPIAVLGVIVGWTRARLSIRYLFLILTLVAAIPLLGRALYISMLLLPFVAVLGALVIYQAFRTTKRESLLRVGLTSLIIFSIILPIWSVGFWNGQEYLSGDTVEVPSETYNDASYLRENFKETFAIANSEVTALQMATLAKSYILREGIYSILNGEIDGDKLRSSIELSADRFPENLYSWFTYEESVDIDYFVLGLMTKGYSFLESSQGTSSGAYDYFSSHSNLVVLVDNEWSESYVTEYGVSQSAFLTEIKNGVWIDGESSNAVDSYQVFQSGGMTAYILDLFP